MGIGVLRKPAQNALVCKCWCEKMVGQMLTIVKGQTARFAVCTGKLLVNFDKSLQEVVWEARWLSHLGFEVPQTAQAILLQETKLSSYYQQLSHALTVCPPPRFLEAACIEYHSLLHGISIARSIGFRVDIQSRPGFVSWGIL